VTDPKNKKEQIWICPIPIHELFFTFSAFIAVNSENLLSEIHLVLLLLFIINDLEAHRHILVKQFPMLDLGMLFKTFERSYEKVFDHGSYIGIPVSVNPVHQFDVMGNDIDLRFLKKIFQIIDRSLHNPGEIILYR